MSHNKVAKSAKCHAWEKAGRESLPEHLHHQHHHPPTATWFWGRQCPTSAQRQHWQNNYRSWEGRWVGVHMSHVLPGDRYKACLHVEKKEEGEAFWEGQCSGVLHATMSRHCPTATHTCLQAKAKRQFSTQKKQCRAVGRGGGEGACCCIYHAHHPHH